MNKILVYTSNLTSKPKSLTDVIAFAKENDKFRICNVGLNAHLGNVKPGDNIITGKGNSIYVIKAFDQEIENLSGEDRDYIDNLTRNYDIKKVGITSVSSVIKYGDWCKFAKPLLNEAKNNSTMKGNNSIKGFSARLKEMFMPSEATDVRIATDGNICVETANGFVAIGVNNDLVAYPEELTLKLPVFIVSKPIDQVKVGDVIARDRSYAKVKSIDKNKIGVVSYTGAGSQIYPIKDFLLGQSLVRVVVSLAGSINGSINPMILLAMSDGDKDSMLPLMLMSQNNGALGANPMLMYAMMKDGGDMKDLLMMSALTGNNNLFGNLFSAPAPVAAAPAEAPVEG